MLFRCARPVRELIPMILRRVIDQHLRGWFGGLPILQISIEEWNQNSSAEVGSSVTFPLEGAEVLRCAVDLAVIPGAHHQMVYWRPCL